MKHQFHPWEGGEGKLHNVQENDIFIWLGCTYEGSGNKKKAVESWNKASVGLSDPSPAMYYNDQQPDKIFYQGLALIKLGKEPEARGRFHKLIDYGEKHIFDQVKIDYFAVSLPDMLIWEYDLNLRNKLHCQYLIGLGNLGLGNRETAHQQFEEILSVDRYHLNAWIHNK
jgi:tetratricopeptide (TPR) repeat protein